MQEKKSKKVKRVMSDGQVEEAARLFGVLAEPARLYLLRALMEGPASVGELVGRTGLRQGTASKHLGILHGVHFVSRAREGLQVVYSISDPAIHALCELMCERMQRDMEGQLRRLGGQGMGVNGSAV
jgi:DNA-binding transcriptional ArsR family regulator